MKKILHIISSPRGEESVSIKLGNALVEKLQGEYPGSTIKEVNLVNDPMPHLAGSLLAATHGGSGDREVTRKSDEALQDVLNADVIVIGVPLFNFGIPSMLKTWLDNIIRPGIAFRYSEKGPEGLITGKKVYVALASGGVYSEGPMKDYDFAGPYLEKVLAFVGMTDVTIVRAEGTSMPALKDYALQKAMDGLAVA
jgi:FMN-dependent NADH-azoreductase